MVRALGLLLLPRPPRLPCICIPAPASLSRSPRPRSTPPPAPAPRTRFGSTLFSSGRGLVVPSSSLVRLGLRPSSSDRRGASAAVVVVDAGSLSDDVKHAAVTTITAGAVLGSLDSVDGALRGGAWNGRGSQMVAQGRSGRSAMYGDAETYVLMEPGEDEQFVTAEELQEILKKWLQEWPGEELPIDLTKFKNVDEAVRFLVNSVCELDLGDGQGSLQWYEVRLD